MHLTRFSWELEVLGPSGPASSTMRLVLLVIGSHVRKRGSVECWPSTLTLAAKTQLSQHSVIEHINGAVSMGWLEKRQGQMPGMKRRGSIYKLRLPGLIPTAERPSGDKSGGLHSSTERSSVDKAAEHTSRPLQSTAQTAEPDALRPLNLTPSLLLRSKKEIKELEVHKAEEPFSSLGEKPEGKAKGAQQRDSLEAWALAEGLTPAPGEGEREFRVRAGLAYASLQQYRDPVSQQPERP